MTRRQQKGAFEAGSVVVPCVRARPAHTSGARTSQERQLRPSALFSWLRTETLQRSRWHAVYKFSYRLETDRQVGRRMLTSRQAMVEGCETRGHPTAHADTSVTTVRKRPCTGGTFRRHPSIHSLLQCSGELQSLVLPWYSGRPAVELQIAIQRRVFPRVDGMRLEA